MLRGIFFDLDNTLLLSRQAQQRATVAAWQQAFGAGRAVDLGALGRAWRACYDAHFAYGTPGYAELARCTVLEMHRRILPEALARCDIHDVEGAERLIQAYIRAEREALALAADARETMDALRAVGLKLGMISNGASALQRDKLAVLSLSASFDAVIIDTEFGHPKPDRRIFDHGAAAVDLPPADLIFIGDNLNTDIAGARAAGWTAVWYNPDDTPLPPDTPPPHYTVRTLTSLLALPLVARRIQGVKR